MLCPLQVALFAWTLTGVVWCEEDDDDEEVAITDAEDEDDGDDFLKEKTVTDDDQEEEDADEDEEDEDEESDFDSDVPETERHQKMTKCFDVVKRAFPPAKLDIYTKKLKESGDLDKDMDDDKAKAAIYLDTTVTCYFNIHEDGSLWAKLKLPFSVHSEDEQEKLLKAVFTKAETMPKISKKQTAMLQHIMMPQKEPKRLTETDEERAARKERMRLRAEEREANKGKEKTEKKKRSGGGGAGGGGGPQVDLPGGLLSMGAKGQMAYVLVVVGSIAAILLMGVKVLSSYQEESDGKKSAKKEKKDGKKKK